MNAAAPTRKIAAILAADVVGYSRLMRADETGTLAAMKALWAEVVQPSVRTHRGRVFKLMGDGMLAEFASVVDAANAAEAIQTAVNARAEREVEDRCIQLRIGINLGDVVVDGSDLYGDGVNIAARLQEVAEPGGIAVSTATHEYLRGKTAITFTDAGARSLKNIDQQVEVWLWPEPQALSSPAREARRSIRPNIAVLPFQPLSPSPDAEFFADGMTEDVINGLSKFGGLEVIASGTMFTYKGKRAGVQQIVDDLGVRYLLEGSLRQAGERMRISARLVDTETGSQLWSERFDRQPDDIFLIQDEITSAIVARIAPQIEQAEGARAGKVSPADIDAWLVYHQTTELRTTANVSSLRKCIEICERVMAMDPGFAPAYAAAAYSRSTLAQSYAPNEYDELMEQATAEIETALRLNNRDPQVLSSAGRVHSSMGRHEQAIGYEKLALEINPNLVQGHNALALSGLQSGRFDLALEALNQALKLSPLDPKTSGVLMQRAIVYFLTDRFPECIADAERSISLGNRAFWTYVVMAIAYRKIGMEDLSKQALARLFKLFPDFTIATVKSGGRHIAPHIIERVAEGLRDLGVPEE